MTGAMTGSRPTGEAAPPPRAGRRAPAAWDALPVRLWRRRHAGIVAVVLGHAPALAALAVATGAGTGFIPAAAATAGWGALAPAPLPQTARTAAAALGLLAASATVGHLVHEPVAATGH